MKKAATLLMAVAMLMAFSLTAFAAENNAPSIGTMFDDADRVGGNDEYDIAVDSIVEGIEGDQAIMTAVYPNIIWNTNDTVDIAVDEIFLVDTTTRLLVLPETILIPGNEYEFQVFFADDPIIGWDVDNTIPEVGTGDIVPLREANITDNTAPNGRLRLRTGKGSGMIEDHELRLRGNNVTRGYFVDIETSDIYNTKMTDVTFTLVPSGQLVSPTSVQESGISFKVGHLKMQDDVVDSYSEGDVVDISNDRPVMTEKQINRLVKAFNYKAVELESDEDAMWSYEGRMSGMDDTNFYSTQEVIPSIMNKFDQDFKFLTFPAGVTFPTNGELRIDVSDVSDDWDRIYTYLYRNGKLTPINTSYDGVDDTIYFRTNYLGAFVMTDEEITDTDIVDYNRPDDEEPDDEDQDDGVVPNRPGSNHPSTGLPAGMDMIAGMGAISLLSAATVIIRKKK
jgi:hypothetical protein